MNIKQLASITLALGLTSAAMASEGHFDIYLGRPAAGTQTQLGGIDVDTGVITPGLQVFETEMGEDPFSGTFFSLEPGFNNPGSAGTQAPGAVSFQAGDTVTVSEISVDVNGTVADLFFWDGTGSVSFAPAVGVDFTIGNPVDTAGPAGAFEDHPFLGLDDLDSNTATFPTPGIYLSSFTASVTGFDPTDPIYLVSGTEGLITPSFLGISQAAFDLLTDEQIDEELEEVIEAAVLFVESNVVVPEPSALVIAIAGIAAVGMRRKN